MLAALNASCGDGSGTSSAGGNGGSTSTETPSGGTGGSTDTTTSSTSTTVTDTGCKGDGDCTGDLVCDLDNGLCVQCTPENDVCATGQFCTPQDTCQVGCSDNTDCAPGTVCDPSINACVGCLIDTDCAVGSICVNATCIPGCSGIQPCQPGFSCCSQFCVDLQTDLQNCGLCNNACEPPANGIAVCDNSTCELGQCNAGWADCNGDPTDGCERNTIADGPCICTPGDTQICYTGAPGTEGIGACKTGTSTCQDGVAWGPCVGQVIPTFEKCNQIDDDCDGAIEPQPCEDCQPGTGTCNGNVGHGCREDGLGYVDETCDPLTGTTCNPQTGRCDGACGLKSLGKSYIGCDYYPTVTANIVTTTFHFAVAVSNTTNQAATVTASKGANILSTVTVPANSVQVIQLPWENTLKGPSSGSVVPFPSSVKVTQGAFRIRSTQPITVYQFNPLEYTLGGQFSYTNDASILLPINVWTGKYRVAARHHFYSASGFYAVTAQKDNTTVTVAPGPASGNVKAGIAGLATNGNGTFTLNAGDVAEIVTAGNDAIGNDTTDVTGTLVTADKPVQVIGGHQCVYIPYNVGYCDHIEETVFPEQTLANEYLVTAPLIPTGGNTPKVQMVRIVATAPNTTLTYEPPQAGAPASIAQAGGWVEIANTTASFRVTGNNPIMVVQYMEGQDAGGASGDPAMTFAVGTDQFRKSYLFHAPTNYQYSYANVVAPTGSSVTLDGTSIPMASFTPIGNTGFSVARVTLSNAGNGNHNITGTQDFGISVYGYGQYTSYWYPGGSNLTLLHD